MNAKMAPPPERETTFTVTLRDGTKRVIEAEKCTSLGSDYVFVDSRGEELARIAKSSVASISSE